MDEFKMHDAINTDTDYAIAEIGKEICGYISGKAKQAIALEDTFLDRLNGQQALQELVTWLENKFGTKITPSTAQENPTVGALAKQVAHALGSNRRRPGQDSVQNGIVDQSSSLNDEQQRQLAYWKQQLDGSQPAELLGDKARPTVLAGRARKHEVMIEGALYNNLQAFCKTHQATPFAVLLAAFRATHYRLTGVEDATIGTPIANRNRHEPEDRVGFFINMQCIRIRVENESFKSLVAQVLATTAAAAAHRDVPFERLLAELRPGTRDLSRHPLVQNVFAVHSQNDSGYLRFEDVQTEPIGDTNSTRFDIEFYFFAEHGRLRGAITYAEDLFEDASIRSMASVFLELLEQGLTVPLIEVATAPLTHGLSALRELGLTRVERTDYPRDSSVPELFRQQVSASPDAIAVKDSITQLTYAELDKHSDRMACWLAQRGLAAESLVAVLTPRSCQAIIALLGILKANLAYLPLDVNVPLGRLESILKAVPGEKLVLIGDGVEQPATQLGDIVFVSISEALERAPDDWRTMAPLLAAPGATSLAYVMFTSGSTGQPKGVMVEHRGIVRLVRNTNVLPQECPIGNMAHLSNLAFDAATWEIYGALLNGGKLVCIDYMTVIDVLTLGRIFITESIKATMLTPALLKHLLAEAPDTIKYLNVLHASGDRLDTRDAIKAQGLTKNGITNACGHTENSVYSTLYTLKGPEECVNGVPVGGAISNSGALVMDARQRLVPLGVMGELVVTGDGLARGYTDPTLNRDRFIEVTVDGETLKAYRTGDRVRYRPTDGQLEFFGRLDHQIKLRGNRIELGEVEHAICRNSAVDDAIALVHTAEGQDPELVSFITLRASETQHGANSGVDPIGQDIEDQLRGALQAALPVYMVPTRFQILDRMPLNANGKVDRAALTTRALGDMARRGPREIVAARNDVERAMCEEFGHVLGLEVGITDNFFALGGHSLIATRVMSRINRRLHVKVTVRDVFDAPRVADLAERVAHALGDTTYVPIPRTQLGGPAVQSFAQGRLWFLDRLYPDSTWYLMPFATRLRGPLQLSALEKALQALEERHEPLRTVFGQREGTDIQLVRPFVARPLRTVNVPGGNWTALTRALREEHTTSFDLENEPGWRVAVFSLGPDDHVLSMVMHHIISDGWSVDILQRELASFYAAAVRGEDPLLQVSRLPIQYQDFSVWEREVAQAKEQERQLAYWKQQLDGSRPAELLSDKPRPAVSSGKAGVHEVMIEGALYNNLQAFCKTHQATPFAVLLAAFRATHYRLTGVEDATIGTPIANRNRQELEDLVGFFVNMQCIRIHVEDESFESLVGEVLATTAAAAAHQDVPFERLVAELQRGARDLSRNPMVQLVFVLHPLRDLGVIKIDGLTSRSTRVVNSTRFDLEFHVFTEDGRLRGAITYAEDLFEDASIRSMASVFLELLEQGLTVPSIEVATAPLTHGLSALRELGLTRIERTDYPRDSSVPELFRQQVSASPDAIAVKDSITQLTYAELDKHSDRMACWLAQRGLAAESLVAVLTPRSCQAIIALLGILKANLAYLPLDVNVPLGRLESILKAVPGEKLVLIGDGVEQPATQLGDIVFVSISEALERAPKAWKTIAPLLPSPGATSLAYIMFTSGSTGQPKGVMVEHRGIVRLVRNTNVLPQECPIGNMAHLSNLAFDAATWEIYGALLNGGKLVCIDYMTVIDVLTLRTYIHNGIDQGNDANPSTSQTSAGRGP
ncbi:AMP-binding enzyme (aureobasidin A1 biosynthesis complex) [Penicillium cosmopolitanum]|uniref:AMP-binding enzyme (Aureobasidin A1 biosynthesis complex) n=1 Tax=Penicillium cosmopolitanum TaxID=1131564 RepID=A0A9W9WAE8_9EURO|nr:AMP-binding enzyme (aureobasidin A1 biosynthesis complex) [Penicillium cosmopolitanum]KAJ5413871.1 AMP-binding enzyme (aureobasidin A1 biosynthesis complex) [Penicillium cosmopolitanum]